MTVTRWMVTAVMVAALAVGTGAATADEKPDDSDVVTVTATFEGERFDMTGDWGDARHCVVVEADRVECFRTRTEAAALDGGPTDAELEELRRAAPDPSTDKEAGPLDDGGEMAAASGGCTLTLYANSYFGGSSLSLASTGFIYSMASYGFDQKASSWTEPGACTATFWDTRSGGAYIGSAGPFSASGDCCLWNNYWSTGGTIDDDISYARMN